MKKYLIIGCSAFLLLMMPVVSIGAVVSNPFGFIGELIYANGDTTEKNDEVIALYNLFLESDLGKEMLDYLHELEEENERNVKDNDILLPLILSYQNKDLANLDKYTMDSLQAREKINTLYRLRVGTDDINKYLEAVRNNPMFSMLNQFTDTTLLSYLDELNGISDSSDSGNKDINVDSALYQKINPFVPTYLGQCTWFAWCRAKEVTGKIMPTGNARDWLSTTSLQTGKEPRTHSVAVFGGNSMFPSAQHVLFVEEYKDGMITFSEGNYANPCYDGSCDMVDYAREHYKELVNKQTMPYSVFLNQRQYSAKLLGYIYTD